MDQFAQFFSNPTGDATGANPAPDAVDTQPPVAGHEPPVVGEPSQGVQAPSGEGVAAQPDQPQAGEGTQQNALPPDYADLRAKAEERDRLMEQINSALAQHQQQQQQTQRQQRLEQQLTEAIQVADRFDTDADRINHLKRSLAGIIGEVEQQGQQQLQQVTHQFQSQLEAQLIKGYPDYLGKQFNLSPKAVEKIAKLSTANEMTTMAQYLQAVESEYAELRSTVQQTVASQAANQARAQGLGAVGGVNGANPTGAPEIKPGTSEDLAPIWAQLLGV